MAESARRAGDAVAALFGDRLGARLTEASRAARAWYVANGDRERAHTAGVWLRKAAHPGLDPILFVALDSNLLAQELATNKDLYLSRLFAAGLRVSDIRFTVGKRPLTKEERVGAKAKAEPAPLPELTARERERVERACQNLPDGLRQSVSRAMSASLRRSKAKNTRKE